jgi:hypothetical protein
MRSCGLGIQVSASSREPAYFHIKFEHVDVFIGVVSERISKVKAAELHELYEFERC